MLLRKLPLAETTLIVAILGILAALLMPLFPTDRDRNSSTMLTGHSLLEIGLGSLSHVEAYGELPAVKKNGSGQALYSWRVSLLPFIEHDDLYKQFRQDEPWDGPHNRALASANLAVYSSPHDSEHTPGMTHFQGFVGPGTAFERPGLKPDKDFPDGTSCTILVVEAKDVVPWSRPADLPYDPAGPLPALASWCHDPPSWLAAVRPWDRGAVAVMVDGSVRFLSKDIDPAVLRALITRNGGEKVDMSAIGSPRP